METFVSYKSIAYCPLPVIKCTYQLYSSYCCFIISVLCGLMDNMFPVPSIFQQFFKLFPSISTLLCRITWLSHLVRDGYYEVCRCDSAVGYSALLFCVLYICGY
jgi:hypothetical protein